MFSKIGVKLYTFAILGGKLNQFEGSVQNESGSKQRFKTTTIVRNMFLIVHLYIFAQVRQQLSQENDCSIGRNGVYLSAIIRSETQTNTNYKVPLTLRRDPSQLPSPCLW